MNRALGVSVAICCHNSAQLLPATLDHLKAQQVPARVRWEVLVVDNASTDGTGKFATQYWSDSAPVELRVVSEPRIGLTNARYRAFQCASNEIISFVDDDNWVAPDWVALVSEIMSVNPDLGAVGSFNDPVADSPIPGWYDEHASYYYAIVRERDVERGNVPIPPVTLTGAGMNIRKQAWLRLLANGFVPLATDRVGKKLSGCGDRELTLALHLAGWRLDIDRRLRLQHFMPKARLEWQYLRRLARATAVSLIIMRTYEPAYKPVCDDRLLAWFKESWVWQTLGAAWDLARRPALFRALLSKDGEGDKKVLEAECKIGTIMGFLQLRGFYNTMRVRARNAPWKKSHQSEIIATKSPRRPTALPEVIS
jgi:glycosyltransferase involved in cell wall biosynthesis